MKDFLTKEFLQIDLNFHFTVYYFPTKEVVVMPESVSFFTPVSYGNLNTSKIEKLLEFADDCFFFGGHKAVVIERSSLERSQQIELRPVQTSMWKTAFKMVAWLACFAGTMWNPLVWCVPVALLALKVGCRMKQPFHIETDPLQVPRTIKICAPKDFRNLRNHEPSSDLRVLPHVENDVDAHAIPVHSDLLPTFFQDRASSRVSLGLDEKEEKKSLDLSGQKFATTANIHRLLDYYYGVGIQQSIGLEDLLSLFSLADFVEAVELKKEILQLLLHIPESREDVRLAPVFRNMLLSPQLHEEEFERLYEWYMECAFANVKGEILNSEVLEMAEKGDVRAQLLCALTKNDSKADLYASQLAGQENPLGQFIRHAQLRYAEATKSEALRLLQASVHNGCMSAAGVLSISYIDEALGLSEDLNQAFELAQRSAEKGSVYGVWALGRVGTLDPKKIQFAHKIFESFHRVASIGYRYGEYFLGRCYERGMGTMVDRQLALQWYMKAKTSFEKRNDKSFDVPLAQAIQRVTS